MGRRWSPPRESSCSRPPGFAAEKDHRSDLMSFLVGRVVLQFALLDVNSGHQMIWTFRTGLDWTKPTLSDHG